MSITLETATPESLDEVVEAVATWQREGAPVQLHPGDLGWHWRRGADELAADVRVWRRSGKVLAAGLVDGDGLIRLGVSPEVDADEGFATRLVADVEDPRAGVLPGGQGSVEARSGAALQAHLRDRGWLADEAWTPLVRPLSDPVEVSGLRVEVVDAQRLEDRVEVHRAAFSGSTFTLERWTTMAAAATYRRARCLVGYDADDVAVAAVTVWSAGPGRPGLLEPVGVHRDHRGHGHGTAISQGAAAALRDLGASSATVCTPSSNVAAVATYASAGFRELARVTDYRRPA